MAKVGAQRAAVLTGKSKSTVQRAMNNGKLSYELDANQRRVIDVSELERVFGIKQQAMEAPSPAKVDGVSNKEIEVAVEKERMTMQIKMLEHQLSTANERIDDLMDQRDKWEKQASQVLITSQYSQKQAEELRAQIKEREERARQRRLQNAKMHHAQKASAGTTVTENTGTSRPTQAQTRPSQARPSGENARNLDARMKRLKAENENVTESASVFRFWRKARG